MGINFEPKVVIFGCQLTDFKGLAHAFTMLDSSNKKAKSDTEEKEKKEKESGEIC